MSSNTQHRIMLAGGGTAGHVNPLLAVADAIRCLDPDADIIALERPWGWRPIWCHRPGTNWRR